MKTDILNCGEFINETVSRLIDITKKIGRMQDIADNLGDEVALDIIDGWTTGDKLLDFVLVACNGVYDPFTLEMQYRPLFDLALRRPDQRILVVQKAQHYQDYDFVILRNIYLAKLRPEEVIFDIDSQSIHIPVQSRYFVWQEFQQGDFPMQGHRIMEEKWLKTGLLHSEFSQYGNADVDENGLASVPFDSVCDIEILPVDDTEFLFEAHGIDENFLSTLDKTWRKYNISSAKKLNAST